MTQDQKEAFDAIRKINYILFDKYDKKNDLDNLPVVNILIAETYFFISISIPDKFDGQEIHLYNSENNDRIYYEKSNKFETFYHLIRRKFLEIKEDIYSIKL